jgi:hypothetical protein
MFLYRIKRKLVGEEVQGVTIMKDEEIKFEEIICYSAIGNHCVPRKRSLGTE